jgi:serine/threonine protein kinase
MTKCTTCNIELPSDALFCPQCGHRMGGRVEPAPDVPVATISGLATFQGASGSAAESLADGEEFGGRYVVERQLGAGAMGVVYAAKDKVTSQTVALKIINPALADRPSARERFLREGMMARDIRHQNVVAMYDVGESAGQLYLVMEYLNGETLRRWLRRSIQEGRDVAFDTARGIIRAVLDGLSAAHAKGVVHRDLKPENVMLLGDPHEGRFDLKVLDFGIARAIGASSQVTTTSSSTGTPLYMAPEQKTAADTVGPPADVYAVTAMLYELLIGVAPEGRWGAPSRERKELPSEIDAIVERGLASRPKSRFQTVGDFIVALDRIGIAPAPPPLPEPVVPQPPPPPPPEPPDDKHAQGFWTWYKTHMPGWVFWNRLSPRQKVITGLVTAVIVIIVGIVSNIIDNADPGGYGGSGGTGSGGQESVTPPPGGGEAGRNEVVPPGGGGSGGKGTEPPAGGGSIREVAPPPPVADMNIAGRWSDEVAGTMIVVTYVDVIQQGSAVSGPIWNAAGIRAGTFSGRVQGTRLEYSYVGVNGERGTGRGQMTADGMHLDVLVTDGLSGVQVRHTLHRNHMPHQ